jgi:hypothetical protein
VIYFLAIDVFESRSLPADLYGKLEQRPLQALCACPGKLFVRHSVAKAEMAGLLCRVIVVKVEDRVLSPLAISTDL